MINKLKGGGFLVVITVTGSSLHKSKKTRLSQTETDERGARGKNISEIGIHDIAALNLNRK